MRTQMHPGKYPAHGSARADLSQHAMLARLTEGDAKVGELAAAFIISQPVISKHLKVLERAGLTPRQRRATARLSHLEGESRRAATAWMRRYREFWDESYDR